jgi:DNA polymerase-3 subunit delta'
VTAPVWDAVIGQAGAVQVLSHAARGAAETVSGIVGLDLGGLPGLGAAGDADDAAPGPGGGASAAAMTHAWLFVGPAGSGRSIAARAFAAALECERPVAEGPPGCGECSGCRTALGGTHADVRLVVPEGLSISTREMRAIVALSARMPSLGRWQVVIIEDADRLTEGASNVLLKAIEEPPPRTVFLLCAPSTHPDDVMVTIRSRCRLVSLGTPASADVAAVLEESGVDPVDARWAAAAAQGHIGRARRLVRDPEARARRAAVLAIPQSLTSLGACLAAADQLVSSAEAEAKALAAELDEDETEALKVALGAGGTGRGSAAAVRGSAGQLKELERRQRSRSTRVQRDALDRALVDLAGFYRDVLLVHSRADSGGAVSVQAAHPDADDAVRAVALAVTAGGALQRLEAVLACRTALEQNVKPRIAIEALMAALRLPAR